MYHHLKCFYEFMCDGIKSPTSCSISDHLNHQIQEVAPASRCLGGERRAQGVGEIFQENFCKKLAIIIA